MAPARRQGGVVPRKDQSPEPEHPGHRHSLRRRAGGWSLDGMRRRSDQGRLARADRRAESPAHQGGVGMRLLLTISPLAAGVGLASAQTPTPPQATNGNANLRAIPDGPGKRVAELQGLD